MQINYNITKIENYQQFVNKDNKILKMLLSKK